MIVTLEAGASADAVRRALVDRGLWVTTFVDEMDAGRVRFVVERDSAAVSVSELRVIAGVAAVSTRPSPHPRLDDQPPVVHVGGIRVGSAPGLPPVVMAGPCSVESREQVFGLAASLSRAGVRFLRGGADKIRTSPYAFRGHGARALGWLRDAADEHGMLVVTEAVGVRELERVARVADLVQIGSRNMHATPLLKAAAETGKPLLLKRGMAATIEEWLLAGECCLLHGAPAVIFCERGIRGFDAATRNLLDLGAAVLLAHVYRVPVIVDPSHALGRRDLIAPLGRAALAAGVAGLMLETHDDPGRALSDGPQALAVAEIERLVRDAVAAT